MYIMDDQVAHVDLVLKTLTKLHILLDLSNFYYRFMLGFSHITWALSQVTKGGEKAKFFWDMSQKKIFEDLKFLLFSSPIPIFPYMKQPFDIETDALDYAIGAFLNYHGNPMAYHAETLSSDVYRYLSYKMRCTSLYRHVDSGIITLWERKGSSTLIIDLWNSCRHN
jgi:hypothetical protein